MHIQLSAFVLVLLTIVVSVLLRYTNSDYPIGMFELFLSKGVSYGDSRMKDSKKRFKRSFDLSMCFRGNVFCIYSSVEINNVIYSLCNMDALFSFDLFMLYIPECKNFEIIHADTRYCTL